MTKRRSLPKQRSKGSYQRKLAAGHVVMYHRHYTKWERNV